MVRSEEVTGAIVEMFDGVVGRMSSRTDDELTAAKAEQADAHVDSARGTLGGQNSSQSSLWRPGAAFRKRRRVERSEPHLDLEMATPTRYKTQASTITKAPSRAAVWG
ncbi:MAG: hypothetical protein QOD01_2350 [Actinomycetota bacterium]|jgi:hypothetical protein|nr:hypothetical protein [Actinomycetota bacterium]